ncbi:hypothetical protein MMC31_000836 [Peltigera leucophlebia]|nr:hypothetical protein [Peltigera leucophlebia]
MPGLEQNSREEQEDCLAQLEEDIQAETSAQHQHLTENLLSLVAPTLSGPKADKYALEFARWLESQARYIYTQIDLITEAKEKVLAAEQLRIRINSIMTDAQQKYLIEQQALAKAKAKLTESVLTEMPTSTRLRQLARARRRPKEFGLGVRIGYKTPGSGFSSSVGALPVFDDAPVSGFSCSVSGTPASGFSSFVGDAPVSGFSSSIGGTPVSGFSSSIGDLPGSGFSSFVGTATASDFPLHNSSRFSTLDAGLQRADQMLSRVYRGNNETSTYPATQVLVRVTTQVPIRVTQFNAPNPPNARQPTLPSTTRQPLSSGPPTARQPIASASVHALGALWGDSFTSGDKSPSTTRQSFSSGPSTARQLAASAPVHASGALLGESVSQDFASKDKETTSGSQPGPRVPFAGGRYPPSKLYPRPSSGSRTRFSGNIPHLTSSPQLTSSPTATASRDKHPGPPSGSCTRFSGNSPHLTSSPQLTSSPMATAGGDKLPAGSYLSTGKRTGDFVVVEDELEDIEDIEDDEEEREEKGGRQQGGDQDENMEMTPVLKG